MDVGQVGRVLLVVAGVAAAAGVLLMVAGALGLGRLPGDIAVRRGGFRLYAPIATCIVVSVVGTVVLNLFFRR
ncbi:MAG: hypothetical protein QOK43_431 [Acidimicrobiaceae bacterium]|jgi:hypothetical protein|nr:hypothetical protein [Acidimicrobiaceae bacterium]MDQ1445677.1 hypothetical protein [Acidimicrobiaceae bacterium]